MYNIVIVGGGIAGLNLLYNLSKDKYKGKVLLIEKNNYLGGRIKTFRKKINNIKYKWEEGAGRFNNKHILLLNLIKELKLEKYIVNISSNISFTPSKKHINKKYGGKNAFDFIHKVIKYMKTDLSNAKNYTFKEYCLKNNIISKEDFDFILDSYGYYSELVEMNAYDTYNLIKNGLSNKLKFYGLSCGFDILIKNMVDKIKSNLNLTIKINTNVKDIKYKNRFIITTEKRIYNSEKCILALPKPNLLKLKILKPINNLLESIKCCPLCRIYAVYRDVWFKDLNKTTTNNNLRFIIPINKDTGLIMISYTDNIHAEYWKNKKEIVPLINKYIKDIYNTEIDNPIYIKKTYWKCGVGYWKKNVDSKIISKKIEKPFDNMPLYICGENYSTKQGWIEGSLLSSNNIYKLL